MLPQSGSSAASTYRLQMREYGERSSCLQQVLDTDLLTYSTTLKNKPLELAFLLRSWLRLKRLLVRCLHYITLAAVGSVLLEG